VPDRAGLTQSRIVIVMKEAGREEVKRQASAS